MRALTTDFIQRAIESQSVWDLGNNVLYRLCAEHPGHDRDDVIIAKVWLIGRAYAAPIERRRGDHTKTYPGDKIYTDGVACKMREDSIDALFKVLSQCEEDDRVEALKVHWKLQNVFSKVTGLNKRSLASRYLHFHFPKRFYIYDSRADSSIRDISKLIGNQQHDSSTADEVDKIYSDFFSRCQSVVQHIYGMSGRILDPRQLDKVLLTWDVDQQQPDKPSAT
jgi:hypothetical protein